MAGWMLGHLVDMQRKKLFLFSPETKLFLIACTCFFSSLLISLIFSDQTLIGLIGETQRRNGFLTYLALLIVSIYTYFKFDSIYLLRLFKVITTLGLILGSYGIIQATGRDFVNWVNPYNPIITTLGNPNFASAMFAMICTFTSLVLRVRSIQIHFKFLALACLVLSAVCMYLSQSRQGLVATGFAIVFYLVVNALITNNRFKVIIVLSGLIASAVSALGMIQIGPFSQFLYKDSVSVRGFYWRAGLKMFESEPLTGVGMDRYGAFFKEFREVEYALRYGFEITSSNAHNTFIQFFATGGLFLGLSYLALTFLVLVRGLQLVRNTQGDARAFSLAILSTWVAFQSQSFISIDNIGLSIWGWVLGGIILSLYRQRSALENLNLSTRFNLNQKKLDFKVFQTIVSSIITIPILVISVWLFQFERDSYNLRIVLNSKPVNIELVDSLYNKITKNPFVDPFYEFQAAMAYDDIGMNSQAETIVENLLKNDPINLYYLSWLAYSAEKNKNIDKAIEYRLKIANYDTWNADNYLKLGVMFREIGDFKNAQGMKEKILSFAQGYPIAESALSYLP
jgi:O-antigen ligase